jgi:hypothetical protein
MYVENSCIGDTGHEARTSGAGDVDERRRPRSRWNETCICGGGGLCSRYDRVIAIRSTALISIHLGGYADSQDGFLELKTRRGLVQNVSVIAYYDTVF